MTRSILSAILMVAILVTFSSTLLAQQTGSIVGTVADQTGAVVPHAKITLTNIATKDVRITASNAEGFFAYSGVVSGDYSVRVEAKGLQETEQTGIHVSPEDRRNLTLALAVATQNASVVVTTNASATTVDSGDLSNTLSASNIQKLALTGRDVTELIKTLPGFNQFTNFGGMQNKANYDTTVTSIQSAVGNGINTVGVPSRAGGADLTSDGTHILDPGCNCNATQTVNPDMVAEVKVTSSAYGADQQTGPVVVAAVGKSGTSTYHGGAYLHFRDGAMNSTDWLVNHLDQKKPDERYWYPGGQFSGPIPYTHKKLLAFAGYEYYNQVFPEQTSGGLIKSNVPTMSERAGHFDPSLPDNNAACLAMSPSVSGYDPTTGMFDNNPMRCAQFTTIGTAGGTVTGIQNDDISAYLAPGALALLNEIPKPNRTPTGALDFNYVKPLINTNNGYMFHTRVDYNFSDSLKLYVSYNQQHELYGSPVMRWWLAPGAVDYPGGISSSNQSKTISGNLVKVFNASTTNEFLANLSYLYAPNSLGNENAVDKTATKYPYAYPTTSTILPSVYNTWYNTDFGVPFQYDTGRYAYFIHKVQPTVGDNITKVFKTHELKAGFSYYGVWDREASFGQGNGPEGTIGYGPVYGEPNSQFGLDPVLNFMTDLSSSFSAQDVTAPNLKGFSMGFYGQDAWKVTRRLTLDLGLRVVHDTPYTDASGVFGIPAWTQTWYQADVAAGVTDLPGMRWHGLDMSGIHSNPRVPLSGHTLNTFFYGPRFGLAYDLFGTGKTVVRGGLGVYYYRDGLSGSAGTSEPMGGTTCQTTGSRSNSYLSTVNSDTITCAGSTNGVTGGSANDPNDHVEPRSLTYNFTISQQMIGKTLLEVSYMGSQTTDLINPISAALNSQVPIGAYMQPDPNPASPMYGQILAPSVIASTYGQDYLPYPNYSGLGLINHGAWANYNSLMVVWNKRQGLLTYALNYTFSKTMGIISNAIDPINIQNDYGVLNADRTHVLNATYAYEVGNRFRNKVEGAVLNGWMVSGITALQSGPPIPQSFALNMGFSGTNSTTDVVLKNPDGNTKTDYGTNNITAANYLGTPDYELFPKLTCNPGNELRKGEYVNPSCFTLPSAPQFVNSGPSIGVLTQLGGNGPTHMPYFRGPTYLDSDLAASRTFKISERQNVQIKFSATNFLNHPLVSFDQSNGNNLNLKYQAGVMQASGSASGSVWNYGVPNEKFGRRVLEMSLRYSF